MSEHTITTITLTEAQALVLKPMLPHKIHPEFWMFKDRANSIGVRSFIVPDVQGEGIRTVCAWHITDKGENQELSMTSALASGSASKLLNHQRDAVAALAAHLGLEILPT